MTSLPDREQAVTPIEEAQSNGARLVKTCALLNLIISVGRLKGLSTRIRDRWCPDRHRPTNSRTRSAKPWSRSATSQNTEAVRRHPSSQISWIRAVT